MVDFERNNLKPKGMELGNLIVKNQVKNTLLLLKYKSILLRLAYVDH